MTEPRGGSGSFNVYLDSTKGEWLDSYEGVPTPDAPEVLRALIATLDSPADTFQRFVFERELAKVDPESKAPSRRDLVLELRSALREKQTETTP